MKMARALTLTVWQEMADRMATRMAGRMAFARAGKAKGLARRAQDILKIVEQRFAFVRRQKRADLYLAPVCGVGAAL